MKFNKTLATAAVSAGLIFSMAGTAFAGEPTGGKPQPNPQPSGQEQPQPKKKHEQPKTVHDWLAQATNAEMTKAVGNFQRHNEKVFKAWHPGVIPEDQFTMQNVPAMDEFKGFSFQKDKTPEPPKPSPTSSVSDALGKLSEEDVNNGIGKMSIKPISEITKDDKVTPDLPKPSPTPSVSDTLSKLSEEEVNNGIGKMNIKPISELTKEDKVTPEQPKLDIPALEKQITVDDVLSNAAKMNIHEIKDLVQPELPKLDIPALEKQITVDDVLNNAAKMNIQSIDELTKKDEVKPTVGTPVGTATTETKTPAEDATVATAQSEKAKVKATEKESKKLPQTGDPVAATGLISLVGMAMAAFGLSRKH